MRILIEIFYWVLIALCPILVSMLISMVIYCIYDSFILALFIVGIGILLGIFFAEYIRKRYGCSIFYSKLMNTNDLECYSEEDSKDRTMRG